MSNCEQKDLYEKACSMIPEIQCPEGCIDCCVNRQDHSIKLMFDGDDVVGFEVNPCYEEGDDKLCECLEGSRCTVHDGMKPIICRLYGAAKSYNCDKSNCNSELLSDHDVCEVFNLLYGKVPHNWIGG